MYILFFQKGAPCHRTIQDPDPTKPGSAQDWNCWMANHDISAYKVDHFISIPTHAWHMVCLWNGNTD